MGGVVVMMRYCASVSSRIHVAMHHGFQGSLGFVLVPSSSPSKSCAAIQPVLAISYSGSKKCPNVCMFFTKVDNP